MNRIIKRTVNVFLYSLLSVIGFVVSYLFIAVSLSFIPVNINQETTKEGIEIYLSSNGIHTDLILPVENSVCDWKEKIKFSNTFNPINSKYVSFGWGNKDFYLKCKTWDDLKFTTAFNAAFGLSSSLMHVSCYDELNESEDCLKIIISKDQYIKLVNELERSFGKNDSNSFIELPGFNYSYNDTFFEANGTYHLFNTCNSRINSILKIGGVRTALWTPFDKGIFFHLK